MDHQSFHPAQLPENEAERLQALEQLQVLDTQPEPVLDELVNLAAEITDCPIALISLVDANRQWFKAKCGLEAPETGRDVAFCAHAILQDDLFVIEDSTKDERFAGNPLVRDEPHVIFYAGMPLIGEKGLKYGTLCVIDNQPKQINDFQKRALRRLGKQAAALLEARRDRINAEHDQRMINQVLESMPEAIFTLDSAGQLEKLNPLARRWTGLSHLDVGKSDWWQRLQLKNPSSDMLLTLKDQPWYRALQGTPVHDQEILLPNPQGEERVFLCSADAIKVGDGSAGGVVMVWHDVSQASKESHLLREERRRMTTILEGTQAGTWEWNVQTGETVFNERWAEICGYSLAELAPVSIETWLGLAHPDDLEESGRLLQEHFEGKSEAYDFVCRMRHKDGHWVWVHDRGKVHEWTDDGQPTWMAGTHLDVSHIKEAELAIAEARAFLESIIDSSVDVSIVATDTEGLITLFNKGAEKLLGYSAEEMVGKQTPVAFHLAEEVVARSQELSDELGKPISGFDAFVEKARSGEPETRRWTYVTKAGEHRHVQLSVNALTQNGHITGYIGIATDITERLRIEEAARLNAERFTGAFQTAAQGMALVSLEGRWMEVNERLCEILGYEQDELLQTDFQTITHPDDLDDDLHLLKQLLNGEINNYVMKKRYFTKAGDLVWVMLSVSLVRDADNEPVHFVSQIHDITEQELSDRALKESEQFLRTLFNQVVDVILITNVEGEITAYNRAAERLFPQLMYETQFPITRLLPDAARYVSAMKAAQGVPIEPLTKPVQMLAYTVHYGKLPVEITLTVVLRSGEPCAVILLRDLTEQHKVQQIKDEFVSTVSHELRTPLTAISGALKLASAGQLGELQNPLKQMIDIAYSNSERLIVLINDLLDMEKLAAGSMSFNFTAHQLTPLFSEVCSAMRTYADAHHVSIGTHIKKDGVVIADRGRLIQVLTNLLSNACKHSPPETEIILEVDANDDWVIVSVIDKGPGIGVDFRDRLFEKFSQAESADTRKTTGTGLGLAICKHLIDRMGGDIGYHPEYPKGSRFWFRLPHRRKISVSSGNNVRLLIVEDDPEARETLTETLQSYGFAVQVAITLKEAEQQLAAHNFDSILLDLYLPDGEGAELLRHPEVVARNIPVLITSIKEQNEVDLHDVTIPYEWHAKPIHTEKLLHSLLRLQTKSGDNSKCRLFVGSISKLPSGRDKQSWRSATDLPQALHLMRHSTFDEVIVDESVESEYVDIIVYAAQSLQVPKFWLPPQFHANYQRSHGCYIYHDVDRLLREMVNKENKEDQ